VAVHGNRGGAGVVLMPLDHAPPLARLVAVHGNRRGAGVVLMPLDHALPLARLVAVHGNRGGAGVVLMPLDHAPPLARLVAVHGNRGGAGVVLMPLDHQPGVGSHRSAVAEPGGTCAGGACDVPSPENQGLHAVLPGVYILAVWAARALQPHPLAAAGGDVGRQLATVFRGVPPAGDKGVVLKGVSAGTLLGMADIVAGPCRGNSLSL